MLARYSRQEMSRIWEDRYRYATWLKVEMAVCAELVQTGLIPSEDWQELQAAVHQLTARGGIDPLRVEKHEEVTKHDVIAFTTAVAEELGPVSRYIHFGLTSSDVVDTALSLVICEAGRILNERITDLLGVLEELARRDQETPTIGRSHGIYAEPTSFGLKFLGWYCEWQRNQARLNVAIENMRFGKLSGAVGANPHWGPAFEEKVLAELNLQREPVSTQVIPRDRHAEFMSVLAQMGNSLERISVELRHLQRSEVREVMEGFKKGQKGSSAMPHKRNPISSENITGCARLLRSYAQAAQENVALWHERDISHSSVERVIFPDATILLDYALFRMKGVLEGLVIDRGRIQANLAAGGPTLFSGHFLLELVKHGVTREQAYAWVQECALPALEGKGEFVALLEAHGEIKKRMTVDKIRELGSIRYQMRNIREIYERVLG